MEVGRGRGGGAGEWWENGVGGVVELVESSGGWSAV